MELVELRLNKIKTKDLGWAAEEGAGVCIIEEEVFVNNMNYCVDTLTVWNFHLGNGLGIINPEIYWMPGMEPSITHILSLLDLIWILWGTYCYQPLREGVQCIMGISKC